MNFAPIAETFTNEGFTVTCFETREEAADYLAAKFSGETIGIGGSRTIAQLDVYDRLCAHNTVLWHQIVPEQRAYGSECTVYLTSANAVAETGEIVNIDGSGNRIAASLYGPKKVVFICGKNKISPDLGSAISRARSVAAPPNAKRLNKKTPCALMGRCVDCNSPERICRAMVIHMRPMSSTEETELILINEDLGY
jgi:hypothetical protein